MSGVLPPVDDEILAFVESHGVVLASARGPVPRLSEFIAGEVIHGSWWGHPKGPEIYHALGLLSDSPDVLVCRVVNGNITLVHRRLWPALLAASEAFDPHWLARIEQVHTASGRHENRETPFALWADPETVALARDMSPESAREQLGGWARPRG